uniref:Phosphatidylglycerophosphate synthase n=1 Tax=uncultured Nocardioidaceae bacterium TaxID=253824 RepID=A0A6J4M0A1_9ACTN|nr:MAG: Putative phosphatidylglycerophosphate synthase [uncultured Nocardioidaceae bacterium]
MFDAAARRVLEQPLDRLAITLDRASITPDRLTGLGLATGLAGAFAAAQQQWTTALLLWLFSRVADGLDGPLARRRQSTGRGRTSGAAGGFLDIAADFTVYGAFVVGVGVGTSDGGWSLLPFMAVLLAYYINGTTFLAFSSIAERTGRPIDDGRSLSFLGGLAEGGETILVHAVWCLFPGIAGVVAWVWAAVVSISALQRVVSGYRLLRSG